MSDFLDDEELGRRLGSASRVVVFTGAGVSAESGLGTFRGPGGLWEQFRPEELATPEAFARRPETVWRWYVERFRWMAAAEPNPGHRAIASWRELFPSLVVVTQNIDRLHQRAGSVGVLELHGTLWVARCNRCGRERPMPEAVEESPERPPRCDCGGPFRPAVVWFGERLPEEALNEAAEAAAAADVFFAIGTSATVYPAAGLIEITARRGAFVVEVNREPSELAALADCSIREPAGVALPRLTEEIRRWRSRN